MRRHFLVIFFLIIILPVYGQQKWTLEDCIRYAIKNNLEIRKSTIDAGKAEQNYRQAKWNMLPSIGASSSAGYSFGRTVVEGDLVNQSYFYNNYNLGATVDIFNGFSVQNQIRYNKFKKDAAENSRLNTIDNLAFEVMNSFFDVIYYEELLKITTEQKDLSQIIEKKTEILVNTGLKAMSDLLEVKADFEKDVLTCIQTKNLLEASWIKLRKGMNLDPDSTIFLIRDTIISEYGEMEDPDIKALFKSYITWSPQIKSFEDSWNASRKNLSIQKAGFFPSLETGASYGTYFYPTSANNDFKYQLKANQNEYVGLSLNIPVFRRNNNITNVKLAKLEYESAKTILDQAKKDMYYEMITNHNDLKASISELNQSRKQLAADTIAFRASEKKYDQGMINVIDFYIAKNRMASTKGQVLHAELTADIKKRVIDFYRGNRFWER